MITAFSFFLFLSTISIGLSCELKGPVVSLSGPITMLLEDLDLLKDKNLKGVSKFHPILSDHTVKKIAGGVFLSQRTLTGLKKSYIFYDQSHELESLFKKNKLKQVEMIRTRGIDPYEAALLSLNRLTPYLRDCQAQLGRVKSQINRQKKSFRLPKNLMKLIFYLGEIKKQRPDTIIGHDGPIIALKQLSHFETYPTQLAYIPWSKKQMNKLVRYKHIGLVNRFVKGLRVKKMGPHEYNFYFRGIFIPGISQVKFLSALQNLDL